MADLRAPTAALTGAPPASIDACGGAAGTAVSAVCASLCPLGTVACVVGGAATVGAPAADWLMFGLLGDRLPGAGWPTPPGWSRSA
jgi:hypothetical protein